MNFLFDDFVKSINGFFILLLIVYSVFGIIDFVIVIVFLDSNFFVFGCVFLKFVRKIFC